MSVSAVQGIGLCVACHQHGVRAVAADEVAGNACSRHLASPGWVPERPGLARAAERERRRQQDASTAASRGAERPPVREEAPRRGRRRRSWKELSEAGQGICARRAVRPVGWGLPVEVRMRMRMLGVLDLRQVSDFEEALERFEQAAREAGWRADRFWNTRSVLCAMLWCQDVHQDNAIQATEARLAEVATAYKERWAEEGLRVEGFGAAASLAHWDVKQRTASNALDSLEELKLAYRLLRGASKEALGAEHGRASIWVLTAPIEPDPGPASCATPPQEANLLPPPPEEGAKAVQAAQAPPVIGSSLVEIDLDPDVDATSGPGSQEPLARLGQRQDEASSDLGGLPGIESWGIDTEYLQKLVSQTREYGSDVHKHPAEEERQQADQEWRPTDRLWDRRCPKSRRKRQETVRLMTSLAEWREVPQWLLICIFASFFDAGWNAKSLMHAIDRTPQGKYHPAAHRGADDWARLLRWRLKHWLDADGAPLKAPFASVAPYARARRGHEPAAPTPQRAAEVVDANTRVAEAGRAAARASDEVRTRRAAEIRAILSKTASRHAR